MADGGDDADGGCTMGSNDDCMGNAPAAAADSLASDVAAAVAARDLTGSIVPMGGDASSPLSMGINRELRDSSKGGGGMTDSEPGEKSWPSSPPPPAHARHSEDRDVMHKGGEIHTLMWSGLGLRRTRELWPK